MQDSPEHPCECDRNARHDDRDGDPEPSAWMTLHVPCAGALWGDGMKQSQPLRTFVWCDGCSYVE